MKIKKMEPIGDAGWSYSSTSEGTIITIPWFGGKEIVVTSE